MLAQLVVISGPDQGRTFSLAEGQTLVIGRGETASARLNDPFASRSHCRVEVDGGKYRLTDAGSRSGTLVNGQPIAKCEVKPGDLLRIGNTELRFRLEGAAHETTKARPGLSKPMPANQTTCLCQGALHLGRPNA
jgi:pSer/pThr/pTyr-binding forkhead associated (FHA) protein